MRVLALCTLVVACAPAPKAPDPEVIYIEGDPGKFDLRALSDVQPLTTAQTARFEFYCGRRDCAYVCVLDGAVFSDCDGAVELSGLADGAHAFVIAATQAENTATKTFTWVIDTITPTLSFATTPAALASSPTATFNIACSEASCAPSCVLDGAAVACAVGENVFMGLSDGGHVLTVNATDAIGHVAAPINHVWEIDATPPKVVSARFTSYTDMMVEFDEPIDSGVAGALANYALSPERPSGISLISVTVTSQTQVKLRASAFHLPLVYSLSINQVRDALGNAGPRTATLRGEDSRVVFGTSDSAYGDLSQWADAMGKTGATAGDAICQAHAQRAGYIGTFRAYLSTSTADAACRVQDVLTGKWADLCGVSQLPGAGPWIRPDGLPFAESGLALVRHEFLTPVRFDETGDVLGFDWAFTGTYHGAYNGSACGDWTQSTGGSDFLLLGVGDALPYSGTNSGANCDPPGGILICLQSGGPGYSFGDATYRQGKRAFVSSVSGPGAFRQWTALGDLSGLSSELEAADTICQTLAQQAGFANFDNYVAWVSTTTDDAYCRLLGHTGKRSANCGVAGPTAPTGGGPWLRTDGIPIANDITDLTTNGVRVPIAFDENGDRYENWAFTGTLADGTVSAANCTDWSVFNSGGSVRMGRPDEMTTWTQQYELAYCNSNRTLYCFEK